MKNNLAENMLRFGVKNLSDKSKRKLTRKSKLDEQVTQIVTVLEKFSKKIPDFIDRSINSKTPLIESDPVNNVILYYNPVTTTDDKTGLSTGTLEIYKLYSIGGIPIVTKIGRFGNNQGSKWRNITDTKNISMNEDPAKQIDDYWSAGKKVGEVLLDIWDTKPIDPNVKSVDSNLKAAAIGLIKQNPIFKQNFQKITRTPYNINIYWKQDNPQKLADAQYYQAVVNVASTGKNAKQVLDAINDTDLMKNITYKTTNHMANGEYPALKIPEPVAAK